MIVTDVGVGCGGRGSVGCARNRRAAFGCERSAGAWTNDAASVSPTLRLKCTCRRSLLAKIVRVRQSRVVLAPVAGVKLAEVLRAQPGSRCRQFVDDGDKTNSSPGRARNKPLKPSRRKCRMFPVDLW